MPTAIRLLSLGLTHWLRTQSVYHALAETMTAESPDTIVLAQPVQPYLCLGYHQELAAVLDRSACARMGLPIVRRRVGGGATYLDADQLFYQCIFHHTRVPATVGGVYAQLLAGPVAALRRLGLDAELHGENEIEILPEAAVENRTHEEHEAGLRRLDPSPRRRASRSSSPATSSRRAEMDGKRIAGIGGGRIGEAAVVVGNVLFDFNYEAMTSAWRVPSASFRRLAAEALRQRVTTLWAELLRRVSPDEAQPLLIEEFARALARPLEHGELTEAEWRRIEEVEKRLVSEEWLSLHANGGQPMTALKISRGVFIRAAEAEVDGCRIRAAFRVRDERIEQAALESEPERDWEEVEKQLWNVKASEWVNALRPR
jgi:lipoate-protein ligase A